MSVFEQLVAFVPQGWVFIELMFWLIAGHAVADYALQNQYMSDSKSAVKPQGIGIWKWVMFMHAMIHGAMVAYATGYIFIGMLEVASHFWIDHLKCTGRLGEGAKAHMRDQALHIGCKVIWAGIVVAL